MSSYPDVVTIMLGTNDAYESNWDEGQFYADYTELVRNYTLLASHPKVYLMSPPPVYENYYADKYFNVTAVNEWFPKQIPRIVKELNLAGYVNVFDVMGGRNHTHFEYFCNGQNCDSIHPNNAGLYRIATIVYNSLFGPTMNAKPPNNEW